jgi:hypothetical protein
MAVIDWICCFSGLYFLGPSLILVYRFIGERCVRFFAELRVSRDIQNFLRILEHSDPFLPRFVSWHDIFNVVGYLRGRHWRIWTKPLDLTRILVQTLSRPRFVTGSKSRAASNIKIVSFDIHRTCIQTTCENGYTGPQMMLYSLYRFMFFFCFTRIFISDFRCCKTKPLAGFASRLGSTEKQCLKRVRYLTSCKNSV